MKVLWRLFAAWRTHFLSDRCAEYLRDDDWMAYYQCASERDWWNKQANKTKWWGK